MSGLQAIPARTILEYTARTSNYTAKFFDDVFCDTSGGTFTVTLPSAATRRKRVRVFLTAAVAGSPLTIGRNGNTINGVAADLRLYVAGDFVELVPDGSGWWVGPHKYAPHRGLLRRETAQTIATSTLTKVTSMTSVSDIGGVTDAANNQFVVLRTGSYLVGPSIVFAGVIGDAQNTAVSVFVNGATAVSFNAYSSVASGTLRPRVTWPLALSAGDTVDLYCSQNTGSNQDLSVSNDQNKPQLAIQEIL